MGVTIAKQRGEGHLINKEPKELSEFKPEHHKAAYDAFSSEEDSDSESDSNSDTQ